MRRCPTLQRRVIGVGTRLGAFLHRSVMASCLGLIACTPAAKYHMPVSLRDYAVWVPGTDSLSAELAEAFRHHGFTVQRHVRGGSGPTAALLHFTFGEPGRADSTWLHIRLADTRTGVIVGAATVVLESFPVTSPGLAEAILDSLGLGHRPPPEP